MFVFATGGCWRQRLDEGKHGCCCYSLSRAGLTNIYDMARSDFARKIAFLTFFLIISIYKHSQLSRGWTKKKFLLAFG